MAEIKIYTTKFCPYCVAAKRLLKQKDIDYNEVDVSFNSGLRQEMTKLSGGRTSVPQIFIGGQHVGGCDELYALEQANGLDPMLNAS